jgi:predicted transcriptional regulator
MPESYPEPMSAKTVTFEVPEESIATVDEIAANLGVDRGSVLSEALAMYLADYEELKSQLEESIAQIDAGDFLTHEEVLARHKEKMRTNRAA